MASGSVLFVASEYSMITSSADPGGLDVMRPTFDPFCSVNHMPPSGPLVIPQGLLFAFGRGNSVITPWVVMRPIRFALGSVNHNSPVCPAVIPSKSQQPDTGNSTMNPEVVILPMLLPLCSVNQRAPSLPVTMPTGLLLGIWSNS